MKYLKRFESNKPKPINRERINWENKKEEIFEKIKSLITKTDNSLTKLESTLKTIKNKLLNSGEVTYMGITGDRINSLTNTSIYKDSKDRSDSSYNKWLEDREQKEEERKEKEARLRNKYPNLFESQTPDYYHSIEMVIGSIRSLRTNLIWENYIKDPQTFSYLAQDILKYLVKIEKETELLLIDIEGNKYKDLIEKNVGNLTSNFEEIISLNQQYEQMLQNQPTYVIK